MNDSGPLVLVAFILVIAVPFDIYVAYRFVVAALERPHIPVLTLAALRSVAIAFAAAIAGILGFTSIWFATTGERLLMPPVTTVLIAAALVLISLPNIYALRLLNEGGVDE